MDQTRQKALALSIFIAVLLCTPSAHALDEVACAPRISQEDALREISAWSGRMKNTDPRYIQVEDVLLRHVDFVIKSMPPQYWLPTLQLMYGASSDAANLPRAPALQRF